MPNAQLRNPVAIRHLARGGTHLDIEVLLHSLPNSIRAEIEKAADEMVAQIPPFPLAGVGRAAVIQRVRSMAVEFALLGYRLGYDHAAWEEAEGLT